MRKLPITIALLCVAICFEGTTRVACAQNTGATSAVQSTETPGPTFFREMRWRCIGPFRAGRTVAISGVPHQPNV
ncbi:MAG: hypothetical protein ABLQ96_10140, partial [Candidatus Acidiferrum sp.]